MWHDAVTLAETLSASDSTRVWTPQLQKAFGDRAHITRSVPPVYPVALQGAAEVHLAAQKTVQVRPHGNGL